MTEVQKAHENFLVPSSEANRLLCAYFKKGSCQRKNSCNQWHVPESTKFKAPKGYLGRTLGVMQTGSQHQRNPNAPTFEERSIEWTLNMEEKQGKQLRFHKNVCNVLGSYSENRNRFFKPSRAANVSSFGQNTSKETAFGGLRSFTSYDWVTLV